jgi:hypothetical protein
VSTSVTLCFLSPSPSLSLFNREILCTPLIVVHSGCDKVGDGVCKKVVFAVSERLVGVINGQTRQFELAAIVDALGRQI